LAKKKKVEKPKREYTRRQISHLQKQKRRQRFIFIGGIAVIVAVVLILLLGWVMGEYLPLHKTVLKVNDVEFDMNYYIDTLKLVTSAQGGSNIQAMTDSVIQQIAEYELVRQEAEKLGIIMSDEEVIEMTGAAGFPSSGGYLGFFRGQLLQNRLREEYFGPQVPDSDKQVHAMAMLVEDERQALEITDRLSSGDNFTALAGEFAQNYYSKNINQGDFGWHPAPVLMEQLGSSIPVDYAFGAEAGSLSESLYDEEMYKQVGYWLIRINDIPEAGSANVSAIFLSSEVEAEEIKARLEAGEDLGPIADEYSDYSPSREKHGELGVVYPQAASETFDNYAFDPEVELGKWSEPIRDEAYWSQGGYWLVRVVDVDEDRELSAEDRNFFIANLFEDWFDVLSADPNNIVDSSYLTEALKEEAIQRVMKYLQEVEG